MTLVPWPGMRRVSHGRWFPVRMGNVRTRCYRAGVLDAEDFPLADVSERLAEPDTVVWVDFVHPAVDGLAGLAGELDLHALAIEDALEPHQRSKIVGVADRWGDGVPLPAVPSPRLALNHGQVNRPPCSAWGRTRRATAPPTGTPTL